MIFIIGFIIVLTICTAIGWFKTQSAIGWFSQSDLDWFKKKFKV